MKELLINSHKVLRGMGMHTLFQFTPDEAET